MTKGLTRLLKGSGVLWPVVALPVLLCGQEMQPRAYLPSPIGVGFAGIAYSYSAGGLLFDPSLPLTDTSVNAHAPSISVGGSFSSFGRSSQVLAIMPYVQADLKGRIIEQVESRYLSGLADFTMRYAINLHGAPAMTRRQFSEFRPRTLIGVSLTATAPGSQYDPNRLINIGTSRWAFKPEAGISRTIRHWTVEGAFGVWMYTPNNNFYGSQKRTQSPLWSSQAHLVRTIQRRHWVAFDFTYFAGGSTYLNGRLNATYIANTRMGATYGLLLSPRQALRFSYFSGVTTRIGSDVNTVGVAYQFVWSKGR